LLAAFDDFEQLKAAPSPPGLTGRELARRTSPEDVSAAGETRKVLSLLAAVAVGVMPDASDTETLVNVLASDVWPDDVTDLHVEMVRRVTHLHRAMQYKVGGYACLASASAYASWAERLLRERPSHPRVEAGLFSALAELHNLVGWLAHDQGKNDRARQHFIRGCVLAAHSGDQAAMADSYYRLGRVGLHESAPRDALRFFQLGQLVAQDAGLLASLAILHANEAWAYAALGEVDRVLDALARARNELSRVQVDEVPYSARFITDPADLDGLSGVVFTSLARHREHRAYASAALEHSTRASIVRGPGEERSHVFDLIAVATGHLLDGDFDTAHVAVNQALDAAEPIGSTRVIDRLNSWSLLAAETNGRRSVQDVKERITDLVSHR
jgi:tetratricopeptide (TPR) repeat protein